MFFKLTVAFRWCTFFFSLTFKRSDKENERNVEERDQGGQGDVAEGRATCSHTSKLVIFSSYNIFLQTYKAVQVLSPHQDLSIQDHPYNFQTMLIWLDGPF